MLELKKDIANEITYLIAQNEITKISNLHKTLRHLYRRAKIPTFGCYVGFEKAFIFVAAKHIFKIDLYPNQNSFTTSPPPKTYITSYFKTPVYTPSSIKSMRKV